MGELWKQTDSEVMSFNKEHSGLWGWLMMGAKSLLGMLGSDKAYQSFFKQVLENYNKEFDPSFAATDAMVENVRAEPINKTRSSIVEYPPLKDSVLIAVLHVALVFRPQAYRYFGADELALLAEQGSPFTVLVTVGLALMFAAWGSYGFSGAGVIRPFPLLRTVFIAISAIHILRGFFLPFDLVKVLLSAYPIRFVVFSTISLAAGLLYLVGTIGQLNKR